MELLINRGNYLLVQKYLQALAEECQLNPQSIQRYRFYLRHVLIWANQTPFAQAAGIRPSIFAFLGLQRLAGESQKKIIGQARKFFEWCKSNQAAQFDALPAPWLMKLKYKKKSIHQPKDESDFVSLEEAIRLATLPGGEGDLAHWRDCAMAARLFLSGERASAAVSSPISAIQLDDLSLRQWPELGVKTKNGKKATTYLMNIPPLLDVMRSWDAFVRVNLPPTAPWYAPINNQWGEQALSEAKPGKNRHVALNKRLRLLFDQAGLPYKSAHKFRHGHAAYGLMHSTSMADYKAVSLNLMHDSLEITDSTYVHIHQAELRNRIAALPNVSTMVSDDEFSTLLSAIPAQDIPKAIIFLAQKVAT